MVLRALGGVRIEFIKELWVRSAVLKNELLQLYRSER